MNLFKIFSKRDQEIQHLKAELKKRSYDAALFSRLTSDWIQGETSGDAETLPSLYTLRNRARQVAENNPYGKRFLELVCVNMIGANGIRAIFAIKHPGSGNPDDYAANILEAAWTDWGKRGNCTTDKKLSWLEVQHLIAKTVARDGECLAQFLRGNAAGNKYGFALKILESDYLDENYNFETPTSVIRMGVQVNKITGEPEGYWLFTRHPGDIGGGLWSQSNRHIFVPASDLLHIYDTDRASSTRGVTWMAAALKTMYILGQYEEAELIGARAGACQMGFYETSDGQYTGEKDENGNLTTKAEPGTFELLPPGVKFNDFTPQHPAGNFSPFVQHLIRKCASGLSVAYSSLASDYAQANYSSERAAQLVERNTWTRKQTLFVGRVNQPVYENWLDMALLSGALDPLSNSKYDKYNAVIWRPRRWENIDPVKDTTAAGMAIDRALLSRQDYIAQSGEDFYDIVDKLADEEAYLKSKNVSVIIGNGKAGEIVNPPGPGTTQPETKPQPGVN